MQPSVVIRPIEQPDLDALYELAVASGTGFTTLPANRDYLAERITLSIDSFARSENDCHGEYYLFVMEDLSTNQVIGTCAVAGHVGSDEVFYSYKVGRLTKQCNQIGVRKEHQTLSITTDFQGATEICTLFLSPEFRRDRNGQLLSRSRFLFMSEQRQRFADPVIAEMRGVSDKEGHSPVWDAIGRQFFGVEFPHADYLTGMGEKQFIADLMPEFPIYTCMLPEEAREAIGSVHPLTIPARRLLEKEGFKFAGYVDLFDGGPTLRASFENIKSIRNTRVRHISEIRPIENENQHIIGTASVQYRCCMAPLKVLDEHTAVITPETAEVLHLDVGDKVVFVLVN